MKIIRSVLFVLVPGIVACNPIDCGHFDLQFQAGVAPILWRHRYEDNLAPFGVTPTPSALALFDSPHFGTLFHIPWTVGGQMGYAWSDHIRFYGEINYLQARGKDQEAIVTASVPRFPAMIASHNYRLFDAYIGGRYYWDYCFFNWAHPFLGAKIGLTHHSGTHLEAAIATGSTVTMVDNLAFFKSNTSIAGGVNGGIDMHVYKNWFFVVTAEIVFSQCAKVVDSIALSAPISSFTALTIGKIGAEIRFPITAAIRYVF
jgi:hypothetical protein